MFVCFLFEAVYRLKSTFDYSKIDPRSPNKMLEKNGKKNTIFHFLKIIFWRSFLALFLPLPAPCTDPMVFQQHRALTQWPFNSQKWPCKSDLRKVVKKIHFLLEKTFFAKCFYGIGDEFSYNRRYFWGGRWPLKKKRFFAKKYIFQNIFSEVIYHF